MHENNVFRHYFIVMHGNLSRNRCAVNFTVVKTDI